jgi:ribosome-associated protein
VRPLHVDGKREGHWVLMDYGNVLIHVFYEETRRFYDLEGLWNDAKRLVPQKLKEHRQAETQPFGGEEFFVE